MLQSLGDIFNLLFIQPTLNVLVIFHNVFMALHIPGAFGWAIIAITVGIRMLMHPFFQKQMHTAKKMNELKPHLTKLQTKYKNDQKKLQAEQMRLYQEAGINPASGCLFALVQIPVIYGLFQTLQMFLHLDTGGKAIAQINDRLYSPALRLTSLDPHFFVYNIALSPAQAGLWHYYLIPVLTAGLQYWQSRVTMTQNPMTDATVDNKEKELPAGKDANKKKDPSTADEFQKAMNTQMKYFFPVMIGYFAYTLPIGLSLYWNTFSLFSIIQHYRDKRNQK